MTTLLVISRLGNLNWDSEKQPTFSRLQSSPKLDAHRDPPLFLRHYSVSGVNDDHVAVSVPQSVYVEGGRWSVGAAPHCTNLTIPSLTAELLRRHVEVFGQNFVTKYDCSVSADVQLTAVKTSRTGTKPWF